MTEGLRLIESLREPFVALCQKYGVRKIWVFGSAVRGNWSLETSDFDFAVQFSPWTEEMGPLKQFFGFQEELETLFGRGIDIVEWGPPRNPFFRRHVEATRQEL